MTRSRSDRKSSNFSLGTSPSTTDMSLQATSCFLSLASSICSSGNIARRRARHCASLLLFSIACSRRSSRSPLLLSNRNVGWNISRFIKRERVASIAATRMVLASLELLWGIGIGSSFLSTSDTSELRSPLHVLRSYRAKQLA